MLITSPSAYPAAESKYFKFVVIWAPATTSNFVFAPRETTMIKSKKFTFIKIIALTYEMKLVQKIKTLN